MGSELGEDGLITVLSTSENINKPFSEQITNLKPSHTTQLQQQLSPSSNQTSIEN
jgi:hypothetical protein